MKKRTIIIIFSSIFLVFVVAVGVHYWRRSPLKVGLIYALTGPFSEQEKGMVEATLFALDEINQKGGILGRSLEPIVIDTKSDVREYVKAAQKLITDYHVVALFGCWSSVSRKEVADVLQKYETILLYPAHYEGMEDNPFIMHVGPVPNQYCIPALMWSLQRGTKKFFLVGTDSVFPRAMNEIIRIMVPMFGGNIVGEHYLATNTNDVAQVVQAIAHVQPDMIINTINGKTNIPFFKALRAAGIDAHKTPTMSFGISERDVALLDVNTMLGDYAAGSYFQSLDRNENHLFLERLRKKYGQKYGVTSTMESAYASVYLWAQAVQQAQTTQTQKVMPLLRKQIFNAPSGIIYADENGNTWREAYIGKIDFKGQFQIVWRSNKAIHPMAYPPYKEKTYWEQFIQGLYKKWGNAWQK